MNLLINGAQRNAKVDDIPKQQKNIYKNLQLSLAAKLMVRIYMLYVYSMRHFYHVQLSSFFLFKSARNIFAFYCLKFSENKTDSCTLYFVTNDENE